LEIDASRDAEELALLPEGRLAQAEQPLLAVAALVHIATLHVRIHWEAQPHTRARIEPAALLRWSAIHDTGKRLLLTRRPVLALERAGLRRALRHVLVAVHPADEGADALVELGQRQIGAKAQLRLEPAELIPQQR